MLEVSIPCRVTLDATGKWQIKTLAGPLVIPTAGIDVGTGPTRGIKVDGNSIIKVSGTVLELGNSAAWSSVELYDSEYPILSTMLDGVKYTLGSSGACQFRAKEAYADITATPSVDIPVQIPVYAILIGCQMRVDVALDAGDPWDADYHDLGGDIQSIAGAQPNTVNTKVRRFFDPFAASPRTSNIVDVRLTRFGGGNFTAQGRIRAIVYYQELTFMDNI